ncbi:hypothetical protein RH831_08825 [Halodesulfurarchaeum sp. HSR-GB]|uniref:hypothetical protein n=1 Tax=Halodesulfurarchaeum sp. HSR-GB TaxID=3074077 RepID=UPI0028660A9C|nr:hypothetical protein [Halodesulfurarchaeum sp. HSR-GB]MDR5657282.1 hypothetical protein [Halodesulfurarchaeum sp. HSR-GB]
MKDFVDNRPKQESLIKDPNVANRPEPETQLDRGGSDELVDDRQEIQESPDTSEQAALTVETVDDGNQMDLSGETAGEAPGWDK